MTAGNRERRYIGRTDEPLCKEGRELARKTRLPQGLDEIFCSPMLRCLQTAEILFPDTRPYICEDLREIDFGTLEGKTAEEAHFAAPDGEDVEAFKRRVCSAFQKAAASPEDKAFVIHGGCIMAIMERFARPERGFYEYHVPNCGWFYCEYDGSVLVEC